MQLFSENVTEKKRKSLEMINVTGSNLFGQWLSKKTIIDKFDAVSEKAETDNLFREKSAKLVFISWSYNILKCGKDFYVIGAWNGLENQCEKIDLPEECINCDLSIVGNDYRLVIVNKRTNTLFSVNLEDINDVKKIKFNIEVPIEKEPKKQKKEDSILKVAACNDSFLFLTADGVVYNGLLPSYVDTSHCRGTVVDVQCGYEHFILLTDAGEVYTWGNGRRLQLGHGDVNILDSPTIVEALSGVKVKKIAAGGWHSLALSEFGDLYAWGWNDTGQLGIIEKGDNKETLKSCSVPTLVDLYEDGIEVMKNVEDIACGSRHSAVLLEDHTIWTAGNNKYGQLGFPVDKLPVVAGFKKSFHCNNGTALMCGLWSTVAIPIK